MHLSLSNSLPLSLPRLSHSLSLSLSLSLSVGAKVRAQLAGEVAGGGKVSVVEIAKTIIKAEGPLGLYAGISAAVLLIFHVYDESTCLRRVLIVRHETIV